MNNLKILSSEFTNHGPMPFKYSCKGENINPPLHIRNLPEDSVSLAIIMEDPDAPSGVFDHWVIWNISPADEIPENLKEGITGTNSKNKLGYADPVLLRVRIDMHSRYTHWMPFWIYPKAHTRRTCWTI
jgi:hypothetical protein